MIRKIRELLRVGHRLSVVIKVQKEKEKLMTLAFTNLSTAVDVAVSEMTAAIAVLQAAPAVDSQTDIQAVADKLSAATAALTAAVTPPVPAPVPAPSA